LSLQEGVSEEFKEAQEAVSYTARFLRRLLILLGRSREERVSALRLMQRLKPGELGEALRKYLEGRPHG